ncbi:MAG: site-specific DNA-methyltransferase [Candidatus Micrarchaeum sp. ARMAN-1]|nr:MAG: site-specific DNA-methyltransferase [Candidatus Micrarchaeum sp. ARMAN-1]
MENENLEQFLNKVVLGNCIEGLQKLPAHSVDLIIADPPYNLSKGSNLHFERSAKLNGMGGIWDKRMLNWDNMPFYEYWQFTEAWLSEAKRVLKKNGSMWVYGTYHNIGVVNVIMQELGIEIINEIIWYKRNAFPNLRNSRFTASHENLLWAHIGNAKSREYTFNYEKVKNGRFPEDSLKKYGKQMRTVWDIPNNKTSEELKYGKHPTQKPLRICERIILASTKEKDTILVPFCGSGSECVAALKLDRHFIAFEIDPVYVAVANKRIEQEGANKKQICLEASI